MPTDPFVASTLDDRPRQERNLAPGSSVPPARGWRGGRPGELGAEQPSGLLLGQPGPNVGYALTLTERRRGQLVLGPHESAADAVAAVAEVAMARAASYGRAPVSPDVECAATALGYDGRADDAFVQWRARALHGAGHEYTVRRELCAAVPLDQLRLTPAALAARATEVRAAVRATFEGAAP